MLLKKIYIMKGENQTKSVLKVTLLENFYTEIELLTHLTNGLYTFILKAKNYLHVENYNGKYVKRRLPPFEIDNIFALVATNGIILSWSAPTPKIPNCLFELAQKYSIFKDNNQENNLPANKDSSDNTLENKDNNNENSIHTGKLKKINIDESKENKISGTSKNSTTHYKHKDTQNGTTEKDNTITPNLDKKTSFGDKNNSTNNKNTKNDITEKYQILQLDTGDYSPNTECKDTNHTQNIEYICDIDNQNTECVDNNNNKNSKYVESKTNKLDIENDSQNIPLQYQIEEKYKTYPHNEILEENLKNSKWIIDEDNDISLGIIYENDKITHICYGKRGELSAPPKEKAYYYAGFWIIFVKLKN